MAFVCKQCLPSEASLRLYFSVLLPGRSSLHFRYPSGFTSSTKHHLILNSCKQNWALPHLTLTVSFISTAVEQITPTLNGSNRFILSLSRVGRQRSAGCFLQHLLQVSGQLGSDGSWGGVIWTSDSDSGMTGPFCLPAGSCC